MFRILYLFIIGSVVILIKLCLEAMLLLGLHVTWFFKLTLFWKPEVMEEAARSPYQYMDFIKILANGNKDFPESVRRLALEELVWYGGMDLSVTVSVVE